MLHSLRLALKRQLSSVLAGPQAESAAAPIADTQAVHELRTRGNQYLANGDLSGAENCFRQALRCSNTDTNALTCLGYTLKEQGCYAEARDHLRRAVALLGNVPQAHEASYLLGHIAELEGDLQAAAAQYWDVLQLKPDFTLACSDLQRLYPQMGREEETPKLLKHCATACPQIVDYGYWYGNWLLASEHNDAAIAEFDRLIQLKPDFAAAHNHRGIALREINRSDEAIESFSASIQWNPDLAEAYSNRGAIFLLRNAYELAIADFSASIRLSPTSATPHINLGEVMRETGQLEAAIALYEKAIALDPASPAGYWNKSLALLAGGNLVEGFSLYEYRFHASRQDNKRDFAQPLWLGKESLRGKTILLHCEQGLGDTIQFCRYLPQVAALGATVILEAPKPLWGLLHGLQGLAHLVERGQTAPTFDYHCPLLSLPHAFNTDERSIPRQHSYLSADGAQRAKWSQRLGAKTQPRVGLVWSGSSTHKNDHNRSLALASLMAALPTGLRYISLQQAIRPADQVVLDSCPWMEHFGAELVDFTDTAALCDLMDVVISVDTSVAHLAAALGKPTWILLPYAGDWRWMLDRSDSPWYPSAKLYRQKTPGEWGEILQRVGSDLRLRGNDV
jgi:tetratricopeptide (TPR) repeat protein